MSFFSFGAKPRSADVTAPKDPFDCESEKAKQLVMNRPHNWEYLLAAELMESKLSAILKEPSEVKRSKNLNVIEFLDWIASKMQEPVACLNQMIGIVQMKLIPACEPSDQAGDALEILRIVNELRDTCRGIHRWELQVRNAVSLLVLKDLVGTLEGFSAETIKQFLEIPCSLKRAALSEESKGDRKIDIKLTFKAPPQIAKFCSEMERLPLK